ncbi:3-hydroxyacyl-CoA dehydrogenase NAD-binding domain-containing protein [uncultured Microbacterium sp.]|uniref:3-hydroxyacyl-CoA dehydrogenase NAD-binding domain-containing protein n=1 Tax=uncultured Microbacterium sp. TaxID=191216 RepID=UPI0026207165|nr:3-hydroxyacyl-CoA dehydrogenase NAD-binding domain-containing protein [uncultured Microbacterium sp.]
MTDLAPAVRFDLDDGIAHFVLDDPTQSANTMNPAFRSALTAAVDAVADQIGADPTSVRGVVISSAKKTFFAGGDLVALMATGPSGAAALFAEVEGIKADLRRLETIGRPVVAAIAGAALGGGFEIALAAHHRIAVDARYDLGLPEVTLGLLPGGGGVTRTVRMLGLQQALTGVLLEGRRFRPAQAREAGIIDEVVTSRDALLPAAIAWIDAHPDAAQPWDRPGYRMPGGTPKTPALAAMLPAFPATLRAKLKGARYRAPRAILAAAVEGAQVDLETASRIESRYFVSLATGQQFRNMTQAFFFDMQAIGSGASRPAGIPPRPVTRLAVLGAGMMGAGIALSAARAGIEVVLKDVTLDAAARGRAHAETLLDGLVAKGRLSAEQREETLARITPTADAADLAGCDAVIEAVFESVELKHRVLAEAEASVLPGALRGSNTSTLPISVLAEGVKNPADVIGIHFFSPVDKMPLIEIIVGEQTSDAALARAFDLAVQVRKTPIVVNDRRGFFTSRVFGSLVMEAARMVGEGIDPVAIERAASLAGFPGHPLAMLDEVSLELPQKIEKEAQRLAGTNDEPSPALRVLEELIGLGRRGKAAGSGFYDYPEGARKVLWPGLSDLFGGDVDVPLVDIEDRLTFAMSNETIRVWEEGVLRSVADANIGSILGIGFPPLLGGALQHVDGYEAADGSLGVAAYARRTRELADRYGDHLAPPISLIDKAETGATYR